MSLRLPTRRVSSAAVVQLAVLLALQAPGLHAQAADWRADAPGRHWHIALQDLPAPFATPSSANPAAVAAAGNATPKVPPGFSVERLAEHLAEPRALRVSPQGDVFVAETRSGRISVVPGAAGAARTSPQVFADGLDGPFGMAFYPLGSDPRWLYVANRNSVVRFPYRNGDRRARGPGEVVVAQLSQSAGGHSTRDLLFSADGQRMYVAVGSGSNVADGMEQWGPKQVAGWQAGHALGAAWGTEEDRADVLVFTPDGRGRRVWATGLRNCGGLAQEPGSGALWCVTNERDGLGDDLVPDYATRVPSGSFFGWPWYYLGAHEDPRRRGERPDLASHVSVPDLLIQAHSAPLQILFYQSHAAHAFPSAYRGDAFITLHGSWNRRERTGYKVVRVHLDGRGRALGDYEDFLTGFVNADDSVWGRPVGLAVANDGALLVSEDANGVLWRVTANAAPP